MSSQHSFVCSFAQPVLWAVHAGISDHPVSGSGAVSVEKIIYHANYEREGLGYDIALIKLKQTLTFNGRERLATETFLRGDS